MKTIQINIYKFIAALYLLFTLMYSLDSFGQVGINNTIPNASSALDITSTSKGLLIPRMTSIQRLAIPAPAVGLMVYETTSNQFFYFDGSVWKPISSTSSGWNVTGNTGTVAGTNFTGTTDAVDFVTKTNNTEKMRVTSAGNVGIGITSPVQKLEVGGLNVSAATSGSAANGITRLQPIGTSAIMDMGVFGGVTHGWIQVRDNASYATNYNLSLNPNGGNVGIGIITPTEKLHVNGAIRMVDGNQANGKVMTSDGNGKGSWQDARRTKYTSVSGTTIATAPPTSLVLMPQMSVTFTANESVVYARFNAAGANAGGCGQHALSFQILLNGVVVQATQTSIEDVSNFTTAKIWDINIEIPLNVVIGTVNTVSVFWGHFGTTCSTITNGPGSAVVPLGSYRVLTVVEP